MTGGPTTGTAGPTTGPTTGTAAAAGGPTAQTPDAAGTAQRNAGWLRLLVEVSKPAGPRLVLAVLAGVAASATAIGLTATSALLISRAATQPPVLHLMVAIVTVRAFGISRGVFRYLERLVGHDATLRVLAVLRVRCYAKLARLAPSGLTRYRRGDLVARVVSDVDAALDVLVRVLLPYGVAIGVAIGSLALVTALQPVAGAVLAVGLLTVTVGVPLAQATSTRRADARLAPLRGQLAAGTVDLLHGMADLTAFGAAEQRLEQILATDAQLRTASARSSRTAGIGAGTVSLVTGISVLTGLVAGTLAVRAGQLDGELLAVVVLTPLAVFEAVAGIPAAAQRFGAARAALTRIAAMMAAQEPTPEPAVPAPGPKRELAAAMPAAAMPAAAVPAPRSAAEPAADPGDRVPVLAMRSVSAGWAADRPAVHEVDLELLPGRRVALVGPSGSGKSTVAALLVRMLDPWSGTVTMDRVDLRELPSDEIRRRVVLCDDAAYMFDTTIEANLRIGRPEATHEQLLEALGRARLLEWVDTLPDGLATAVGEHGVRLSGGQRRRVALARAFLADPAVLILDEPTEHLDEETADAITADLLAATRGRTVLLITHRTSGLDEVDEVVRMADGRIVAAAAALR